MKSKPEKKTINFEFRIAELVALDELCAQLDVSRTQFIKDAINDRMKKYQALALQLENTNNLQAVEQKLSTEIAQKMEIYLQKIAKLPEVDPQEKTPEKNRIIELLKIKPMKGLRLAMLLGIQEEHVLKILSELEQSKQVEFNDGKWRAVGKNG